MVTLVENYKISEINSYGRKFVDIKDLPFCDDLNCEVKHYGYTDDYCDFWNGKHFRYLSKVKYKNLIIDIVKYDNRKDYCLQDYDNNIYYVKTRKDAIRLAKAICRCTELQLIIKQTDYNTQMVFEYELPDFLGYKYKRDGYGKKYNFVTNS